MTTKHIVMTNVMKRAMAPTLIFGTLAIFTVAIVMSDATFGAQCKNAGVKAYHFNECVRLLSKNESITHLDFNHQ